MKMDRIIWALLVTLLTANLFAGQGVLKEGAFDDRELLRVAPNPESNWGLFMGLRTASIPFATKDDVVSDIFPNFYYEGERFFLRGLEGGFKAWEGNRFGVDVVGRYRFFDIPADFQNTIRGDAFDMGLQGYWMINEETKMTAELLSDTKGNFHAAGRLTTNLRGNRWLLTPELGARFKTSAFNTRYYGLETFNVGSGAEIWAGISGRYRVWRNLHLQGGAKISFLDHEARTSPVVDDEVLWEANFGFGFHDYSDEEERKLNAKPYWRLSQGRGTSSSLAKIIRGNVERENVDVDMTSLFYGYPLSDTLLGLPIEVYLTPGVVYHYHSSVQSSAVEVVLGVKAYYTLPLPWRVRIGAAEGISYTNNVTYYEAKSMESKGVVPSRLLNYLDISVDLNLGDVLRAEKLEDLWLGYGIHHRSGIFGTSSAFGRISGGSNFPSVYLQWSCGF